MPNQPFRIGTTSYIIPDEIVPNVQFLGPLVEDIELVLFESDEFSNLPDEKTIEQLQTCAKQDKLTYTVHLPLDADLGAAEPTERKRSVAKCERILQAMTPLNPFAYLVHFPQPDKDNPAHPGQRWLDDLNKSIERLLDFGADPQLLCVETLQYPFEWVEQICCQHNLALCLDIGHILLSGQNLKTYLDRYLTQTRVIHLHGIRDGQDHQDLGGLADEQLDLLFSRCSTDTTQTRVITIEVFNQPNLVASLEILKRYGN